jgi:hypothetical protein
VVHREVDFATDEDVRVATCEVGEEVEGEDHGAIGGVFEGDDALRSGAGLDGGEDVFDACLWDDLVFRLGEALDCCL